MDNRRRNGGSKRNSVIFDQQGQPVQRQTSKKVSSADRHGRVHNDALAKIESTSGTITPNQPRRTASGEPPALLIALNTTSPASMGSGRGQGSFRENPPNQSPGNNRYSSSIRTDTISRPRTRTLEERIRDRSPTSLFCKTRSRLGSLQSVPASTLSELTDSNSSMGVPYIIPTPSAPPQTPSNRHRLVKSPPRPLSPIHNLPFPDHLTPQASPTLDTSKILQLMKTTCGRMHGILSFRTSRSGAWSSGYCAINVATGSLIYQMKGDVSHAKTLIPDLRGCRVRTQLDGESRATFLDVSTHNSGLGIHLRPHVLETFDSWLAALLCWQPIRPKGSQNKMTKPQTMIAHERRLGDRKRNSAINPTKDAAIIKVGKMLFWDLGARTEMSRTQNRRISTYKQQRSASGTAWRKVSCTLQENGHFKLFLESDTSLIAIIPLSSLSRCAVQRLDPSVLDDEFCLAIYPQYTTPNTSVSSTRPIYFSMESRVLLEVWFVLLRAFTVPELYGPEQSAVSTDGAHNVPAAESPTSAATSMFRVEKVLNIRIIEAKMHAPKETGIPLTQTSPRTGSSHGQDWVIGDYHAEVNLDGEIRARTAVKSDTSNPFWREDYEFPDSPPVISSASIVIKSRHLGQKDWTLISHYAGENEHGDVVNLGEGGDIEISPLDTLYGTVDLRLDDLERGKDTERWWPIYNDHDETVGELLMKVRTDEVVVLMSQEYKQLSELLHSFSNTVTHQIATATPMEMRRLPETLLNIFQVSGQASNWLMSLVEEEIDGIHKESSVSRFRYSRRIASNDSFDSGVERELLLRDLGKSATVEANLLFRGNSLLTKSLDLHMRRLGKEYLEDTLSERIRDIDESDPECEVDPNRVRQKEDLQRNWRNLIALTEAVWKAISTSAARCPPELRMIFRHVRACAEDRYGDFLRTVTYSSVSGFLFLRFFCPAVLNPKLFGLLKDHPRARAQRTLTLIAKALQTLANLSTFGSKEPWMEPMNAFLTSHRQEFKDFVDAVCAISSDRITSAIPPSYATPITILSRLPATSREGFPSLPYLIDQAREFAALVGMWIESRSEESLATAPEEMKLFDYLCEELLLRTRDCLNQAEQAERPSGILEVKWEELIEQMDRKARGPSFPAEGSITSSVASLLTATSQGRESTLTTPTSRGRMSPLQTSHGRASPVPSSHGGRSSPFTIPTHPLARRRLTNTSSHSVHRPYTPTSVSTNASVSRPAHFHTTNGRVYPTPLTEPDPSRSPSEADPDSADLTPPGSLSGVWDPGTESETASVNAGFPTHALHWNDNADENADERLGFLEGGMRGLEVGARSSSRLGSRDGSARRLIDVWGFRRRGNGGMPSTGGTGEERARR
ncbi:hypothetical protein MMC13_003781 [Lambiella insularis]|nr:hypothetical protein [Lambiella insularis]